MGLDSVELLMEIEDTFGISVPDADAERLATVGGVCTYLAARLGELRPPGVRCESQATFYALARPLARSLGVDARAIRPSVRLGDVGDRRALNAAIERIDGFANLYVPRTAPDARWCALLVLPAVALGVWSGSAGVAFAGFFVPYVV